MKTLTNHNIGKLHCELIRRQTIELFAVHENKCLTGYAVKKLKSPSLMICNHSCFRNSWCTSTNFKESSLEIGKGTCELNEHGEIGEDTELEDEQGVTFSIVQKVK
ncbi:unnamed protein product [Pocillopora meandrina]|uniref:Apple domain-containing protein n=1 Tax=Pocillopora meandrina TaxID=46732 RepID=A0AAU9W0F4_9CNID|nr:unnamed protein product [Pocillopora meandrina]